MPSVLSIPEVSMMSLLYGGVIGGVLLGISYLVKSSIRPAGVPPGPARIPIIGNTVFTPSGADAFNVDFQRLCKTYGPIFSLYLGNTLIIIISDYAILREAFVTKGIETAGRPDSDLIKNYNPGYPNITGIIDSSYSEEWKRQRNVALSILRTLGWGKSIIEERIQQESAVLVAELDRSEGKLYNPTNLISTCVANIICSLLFGQRFKHDDREFLNLLKAIDDLMTAFGNEPGSDYVSLTKFTSNYKQVMKDLENAGRHLVSFYKKQIAKAKARLANGEDPSDFVTLYIKETEKISGTDARLEQDWLIQLISDFFLAGAETTATTLRWAVLHMANNQEAQDQVAKELHDAYEDYNQIICLKDREHLPFTEATIMEIQRISAIVPMGIPHQAMVETGIAGYRVPKGTEVWSNIYGILRDPKLFAEPEKFRPERFLNTDRTSADRLEGWIPFSMGRRTCLGEQLARQELFLFFTNIIRSFKILPPEGVDTIAFHEVFKFVLKPTDYSVRFVRR